MKGITLLLYALSEGNKSGLPRIGILHGSCHRLTSLDNIQENGIDISVLSQNIYTVREEINKFPNYASSPSIPVISFPTESQPPSALYR
jgi:hypothetical protein